MEATAGGNRGPQSRPDVYSQAQPRAASEDSLREPDAMGLGVLAPSPGSGVPCAAACGSGSPERRAAHVSDGLSPRLRHRGSVPLASELPGVLA